MPHKKLLFIGFGDIAARTSHILLAEGCNVTGIARSEREVPPGLDYWRGAVGDSHIIQQLNENTFEVAIITLTPDGRRAQDYREAYEDTSRQLARVWSVPGRAPRLVIYISSTSVYAHSEGEWVDEDSEVTPQSPQAQSLVAAERIWQESKLNTCIVRFSGIYGPGRTHLLRQVAVGQGGARENSPFTNRIHIDDCVGSLLHLCHRHWLGKPLAPLYVASDDTPVRAREIRQWLAEQMGYGPDHLQDTPESGRSGSKRCRNERLRASGYEFKHPSYQSGYTELLKSREWE